MWYNLALSIAVFVGLYFIPAMAEKFITLGLGIKALIDGVDPDKMPKKK